MCCFLHCVLINIFCLIYVRCICVHLINNHISAFITLPSTGGYDIISIFKILHTIPDMNTEGVLAFVIIVTTNI